jgi:hypothetical protein
MNLFDGKSAGARQCAFGSITGSTLCPARRRQP